MPRDPYAAHLCALHPVEWAAGFDAARAIEKLMMPNEVRTIYELVRDSDYGLSWARCPIPYTPWGEGFVLGLYGIVALRELQREGITSRG
jgi:hypothetical protein